MEMEILIPLNANEFANANNEYMDKTSTRKLVRKILGAKYDSYTICYNLFKQGINFNKSLHLKWYKHPGEVWEIPYEYDTWCCINADSVGDAFASDFNFKLDEISDEMMSYYFNKQNNDPRFSWMGG